MIHQSHPEKYEREPSAGDKIKTYPCDETLRELIRAMRASGETSNSRLAKETGLDTSRISQYLNDAGNLYPGDTEKIERKLRAWLEQREVEKLAGIATIETTVTRQIAAAARHARKCRVMEKSIGRSGIGKTRGASLLAQDESNIVCYVSRETGTLDAIRSFLFKQMGIQGPRKRTANRKRVMYDQLVKRLKDSQMLLVFDQAHRLSSRAIDFLTELWNDTRIPQLWLGTDKLVSKLDRDEQWASRLDSTIELSVEADEVRPLVEHQIKSRLPQINGEMAALCNQCEKLAMHGSFRRVEMRLATMLYLADSPRNQGKSWCDLFNMSEQFLTKFKNDN